MEDKEDKSIRRTITVQLVLAFVLVIVMTLTSL